MGKTLQKYLNFCGGNKYELKSFNILLLGISNSGKTELGHVITGEKRKDFAVTNGVRQFTKNYKNFIVKITEIGGSVDMQRIWHHYYVKTMGIIFTIDISDPNKMPIAFKTLQTIVEHRFIQGKSILVMATKSDLSNDIEIQDIEDFYNLEFMANHYKCPMSLLDCQLNDYSQLYQGLKWLYNKLENDYEQLRYRIEYDSRIAKFEKISIKKFKNSKSTQTTNRDPVRPLTAPARTNKILLSKRQTKIFRLKRIIADDNNINKSMNNNNFEIHKMCSSSNKFNLVYKLSTNENLNQTQIENDDSLWNSRMNGLKKLRNNRVDSINEIFPLSESSK